jgi:hypothetical protein
VIREHIRERTPFGARVRGAGRIAGTVDQQQARLRRDGGFELARRELVARGGRAVGRDGQAVREQDHVRVADPERRRDHGLVARIENGHAEVVDSLLRARAHEDLVALVGDRVVLLELLDDRVLELDDAVDGGITREAVADRFDTDIGDVLRCVEIGLAGAEADDVLAFRLQFRGARGDGESGRGLDALNAAAERIGHDWTLVEKVGKKGGSNGRVSYAICPRWPQASRFKNATNSSGLCNWAPVSDGQLHVAGHCAGAAAAAGPMFAAKNASICSKSLRRCCSPPMP